MILRSVLMLIGGLFVLPLGLAFAVAFPSFNDHHPLIGVLISIPLISMGPALLITGAFNLIVGLVRAIRAA